MSTPFFTPGLQNATQQPGGTPLPGVNSLVGQVMRGMQSMPLRPLGLAMRFQVVVAGGAGMNLGHWTSCTGLRVEFKYDSVREGGDYSSSHVLPKTVDYEKVTLVRAVENPYSAVVQQWLSVVAAAWQAGDVSAIGSPVIISVLDARQMLNMPAAEWVLADAFPVSWSGPSMGAKSSDVATETLVLQHSGFLGASSLGLSAASAAGGAAASAALGALGAL